MTVPPSTTADHAGRIVGEEYFQPASKEEGFFPVALEGLLPGTVLGFQVFALVNGKYILVHSRTAPFTEDCRELLLGYKQPTLYVSVSDGFCYQAYTEAHLAEIVGDKNIPEPVKARLVYGSTRSLVREILTHPDDPDTLTRTQRAAQATVDYILRGHEAFLSLFSSCSIDCRTYTHSVNVCIFSVALAEKMGIIEESLTEVGTAVLLHDIGKARIDSSILNKASPLTEAEWKVMRKHPEWGLDLVKSHETPTPEMGEVILLHHEKLDGSGYPEGLRGSEIPTLVRITTICDIFDALTTNRSYRSALSTFETLSFMQTELAGRIDRDILEQLVLLLKE
jgi:HD-GYP domain-containing protein (c-di-GMP phosphodiesterase class II)